MRGALTAALALALAVLPGQASAFAQPRANASAPAAPGTAQRRTILDALRPAVEARLGPNVEFVVRSIDVRQGWAVVTADPQRRGGGRIDGRRIFGADFEHMDGLTVTAVMRFSGGRWHHVDHAVGATDVWYCGSDAWPADVGRRFGC
ncbi:MAG TPA: hypothetical protein VGB79_15980 [Allosphingosinicella sp.]|jgi:hypothetical protein